MHFVRGPDRLADLQRDQFFYNEGSARERKDERGHRGRDRAKRHVTKDVEAAHLLTKEMEVIHHGDTSAVERAFAKASNTRPIRAVRLPLTRIKSPGEAVALRRRAASSGESTALLFSRPAFRAACAIAAPASPTANNSSIPSAAAVSPTSRCPRSDSSPSSFIWPSTATRRPSASSSTSVRKAAFIESGFAL